MKAFIPAIALTTLYSCAPVWADTGAAPRSVTVHFEDLNINSAHGAARLYQRIRHAAEDVCGGDSGSRLSLALASAYTTCVRTAVGQAVARVNHPMLSAHWLQIVNDGPGNASRPHMRLTINDLPLSE